MTIRKFYSLRPDQIENGDVFVVTVVVHVSKFSDRMTYRAYRCSYPTLDEDEDGVPQGDRIFDGVEKVVETLVPVLRWANATADPY